MQMLIQFLSYASVLKYRIVLESTYSGREGRRGGELRGVDSMRCVD